VDQFIILSAAKDLFLVKGPVLRMLAARTLLSGLGDPLRALCDLKLALFFASFAVKSLCKTTRLIDR
jgi:hypothetical protein